MYLAFLPQVFMFLCPHNVTCVILILNSRNYSNYLLSGVVDFLILSPNAHDSPDLASVDQMGGHRNPQCAASQ